MDISESVAFIRSHKPTVIERFYERFLNDYPQVRPDFVGIDLQPQAMMLTMALIVVDCGDSAGRPVSRKPFAAKATVVHPVACHESDSNRTIDRDDDDGQPRLFDILEITIAGASAARALRRPRKRRMVLGGIHASTLSRRPRGGPRFANVQSIG